MIMNDYQQAALRTAASRDKYNELFHLLLGLVGETGEIAEKAKKIVRDKKATFHSGTSRTLRKSLVTRSGMSPLLRNTSIWRLKMLPRIIL